MPAKHVNTKVEAANAKNADLIERLKQAEENASSNPEVLAEKERLREEAQLEREKVRVFRSMPPSHSPS